MPREVDVRRGFTMLADHVLLLTRVRKGGIATCVALHFVIGTLCFAKAPSALLEVPGVATMVDVYERFDFAQTWRMFAPPSQTIDELGYALELPGGWTPLKRFDVLLRRHVQKRFTLPRGYIRVADHLRHPFLTKSALKDQPFFFHYFQQLGTFFCFGDGAVPGLRRIRFYSIVQGVPPFFSRDGAGHSMPLARDYDKTQALYERDCTRS